MVNEDSTPWRSRATNEVSEHVFLRFESARPTAFSRHSLTSAACTTRPVWVEPTSRLSPAENHLPGLAVPQHMIDGSTCPLCSGHVSTENGTEYTCDDCGEAFDSTDLFLP